MTEAPRRTAAIVLAAGASRRLGEPKQLLDLAGRPLLDATLAAVRQCDVDQRVVAIGGPIDAIRTGVDLTGFDVVEVRATDENENESADKSAGCSASIAAALGTVDPAAQAAMVFLGDQPGVSPTAVQALRDACELGDPRAVIGVCRYDNGIGHPFWFDASMFDDLTALHGDKATWKLIESDRWPVTEVVVDGQIPLDVDTWDDYESLVEWYTVHGETGSHR